MPGTSRGERFVMSGRIAKFRPSRVLIRTSPVRVASSSRTSRFSASFREPVRLQADVPRHIEPRVDLRHARARTIHVHVRPDRVQLFRAHVDGRARASSRRRAPLSATRGLTHLSARAREAEETLE